MNSATLLQAENIGKSYAIRGAATRSIFRHLTFAIAAGEVVALIGRSGTGKSTLARCLTGLEPLSEGSLLWEGRPAGSRPNPEIQLVLPDAPLAFNPHWSVKEILDEPFRIQGTRPGDHWAPLLERLGIQPAWFLRKPAQLSGGERKRIAIARALAAANLRLLILDEPLAGLDPRTRAEFLSILRDLNRRDEIALLYISHDLASVESFAARVLVLDGGAIVEDTSTAEFYRAPRHSTSRALLAACLPEPTR